MRRVRKLASGVVVALLTAWTSLAAAQPPSPSAKGYEVEWVYRVRYGFIDEWWDLFRKYQIPVLDRAKALGYIIDYRVYHPQFHTAKPRAGTIASRSRTPINRRARTRTRSHASCSRTRPRGSARSYAAGS